MTDTPFRFRTIVLPALTPTLLFAIGEGAIIPVLPVIAAERGADLATAGLIASMLLIGNLVGDLPSSALIARFGERRVMIGASGVSLFGLALAFLAPNAFLLGLGILLVGIATAAFALARHAFLTSFVPLSHRARALSTLGGTFRLGYFVGPFLTALLIAVTGDAALTLVAHAIFCTAAGVILLVLPDPTEQITALRSTHEGSDAPQPGLGATLVANRRTHGTIGLGAMAIAALRASRTVALPLWAVSIGVDASTTAVIIGIASAFDVALFYLGGVIMDRRGRLWTALPSTLGMSAVFIALAFTHDLDANVVWFAGLAIAVSIANGIGAGILMTIGADLADPRHPAAFLGAWRLQTDAGGASASIIISGVTALASLPVALGVVGALGLVGAVLLVRFVPRPRQRG